MNGKTVALIGVVAVIILSAVLLIKNGSLSSGLPSSTSGGPTAVPTAIAGSEDISVCDPAMGTFSTVIDNEYFPLPVGHQLTLVDPGNTEKVQITVLSQTQVIAGVETRVVEEREWSDGELAEVSRNYFVQAKNGAVCYFGEEVDDYKKGAIVGHGGAWKAGEGANKPGIIMPALPEVGQSYQQEIAPGVAMDSATHIQIEDSFETDAGVFNDVLLVDENPSSTKRYAPGVGLIYDDGMELTDYTRP